MAIFCMTVSLTITLNVLAALGSSAVWYRSWTTEQLEQALNPLYYILNTECLITYMMITTAVMTQGLTW